MYSAKFTMGGIAQLVVLANVMLKRLEGCVSTPVTSNAVVPVTTPTTTPTPCQCPSGNCGFVIDSNAATTGSIAQMQLQSVGSCACGGGETEGCYPAQPNADTGVAGDSFIADLQCPIPGDFCVCAVDGECFTSILDDSLSDIVFFPFQDAGGCFVYAVPFCFGGDFNQNDGLMGNRGTVFTCSDGNGVIGSNTAYIKAFSASCNGCGAISAAAPSSCTSSTFVAASKKKR